MSDLTEIVETLETRIVKLLQNQEALKRRNAALEGELTKIQIENQELQDELDTSEKRIQSLRAANALLGSNEYKKETKLKINGLIREIDQCIVQLSE